MFAEIMMWFYGSMALMVAAILWFYATRRKSPVYPPEWVCDGCGQVCSDLLGGYCEYCVKKLA